MLSSLLALSLLAQQQTMTLGAIDLFGHTGLDEPGIRAAIPVKTGETIVMDNYLQTKEAVEAAVERAVSRKVTNISLVGFDPQGRMMMFIGVDGPTVRAVPYRKLPGTTQTLPAEAMKLYKGFTDRLIPALQQGGGVEDDSNGFALFSDPQLRAIQLDMRRFALRNEQILHDVLAASKSVEQRKTAAQILGYAVHSPEQLTSLLNATRDPDETVRNNSIRAIGVILKSDPKARQAVPAGIFVDMVRSGAWSDRNKGIMVLEELTRSRDTRVLGQLRKEAVPSLVEMSRWQSLNHNESARRVLGRIAGFEEKRIAEIIASRDMSAVYKALGVSP